jgi:hypothetical protein
MFKNKIGGTLPKTYANWTKIRTFYIHENSISGILPKEYSAWENIDHFVIISNNFF